MPNPVSSPVWIVPLLVVAAYAVGGFSPGWWLVRRKAGLDLRKEGSGATGATNAARVLGKEGYFAVLVLDTLKGFLVVAAARGLAPDRPWAALVAPAVIVGHIWPVWLGFKGGRGAAPLMGVFLGLDWRIVPFAWIPGVGAGLATRKGFAARAVAFVASLPIGWWLLPDLPGRVCLAVSWGLVLLAHRHYFDKA